MPIIIILFISVIVFFIVRNNIIKSKTIKEAINDPEYINKIITKWAPMLTPFEFSYGYDSKHYSKLFSTYFIYLIKAGFIIVTPDDEIIINTEMACDPEVKVMQNIIADFSRLKDGHMYINVLLENITNNHNNLALRMETFLSTIRKTVSQKLGKKNYKQYGADNTTCETVLDYLILNKKIENNSVHISELIDSNFDETLIFKSRIELKKDYESLSDLSQLERIAVSVLAVETYVNLARTIENNESSSGCGCSSD